MAGAALITNVAVFHLLIILIISQEDPDLKAFGEVAKKTFCFVKLVSDGDDRYHLEKAPVLWDSPEWTKEWERRKSTLSISKLGRALFDFVFPSQGWRKQVIRLIKHPK